ACRLLTPELANPAYGAPKEAPPGAPLSRGGARVPGGVVGLGCASLGCWSRSLRFCLCPAFAPRECNRDGAHLDQSRPPPSGRQQSSAAELHLRDRTAAVLLADARL